MLVHFYGNVWKLAWQRMGGSFMTVVKWIRVHSNCLCVCLDLIFFSRPCPLVEEVIGLQDVVPICSSSFLFIDD